MKRIVRLWFIALVFLLSAGLSAARGLDEAGSSGGDAETADSALPMRIVQAGPSAFLVVDALYMFPEAADRVAALSGGDQGSGFFAADIDPQIDEKTVLPRRPAAEEILAHRPDLVVMKNFLASRMGEPIERVGVETLYLDLESPEAWREELAVLGDVFGNPSRAEELIGYLDERIEAVEAPLADLEDDERPSTLFLYWSVKDGTAAVNVPPLSWMQTRLVEMAGGTPVWENADLGERWTKTNIEQIAAWNPDVIVVAAYHTNADAALEAILADPVWASLDAAKAGRIHAFPADYYSWDQPDARWLLGLNWLAGILHPDKFPDREDDSWIRSFYRDFFFLGDAEYDELIAPRLRGMD